MEYLMEKGKQLPSSPTELAEFILVSEERVQAMRAQIRAISKAGLAKEVYDQKLLEAQEVSSMVIEAGRRMGELLLDIPVRPGKRTDITSSTGVEEVKTKAETLEELGISKDAASDYQRMAKNPDAVRAAIEKAMERGDIVSRQQVMKEIKAAKEEGIKEQKEKDKKELEDAHARVRSLEAKSIDIVQDVIEVIPADYEELKAKAAEAKEIQKELDKAKETIEQHKNEKAGELHSGVSEYVRLSNQLASLAWIFGRKSELADDEVSRLLDAVKRVSGEAKKAEEMLNG